MFRSSPIQLIALCCAVLCAADYARGNDPTGHHLAGSLDHPVSLLFEDVHLSEACDLLAQTYPIRIVIDNRVVAPRGGQVQTAASTDFATDGIIEYINLKDVPINQALSAMLHPLGLAYSVQKDFIWISTPERIRHETFDQLATRVFQLPGTTLPDCNAAIYRGTYQGTIAEVDLVAVLRRATPMIVDPKSGELLSYMRFNLETNQIVVHNSPENLQRLEALLELLLGKPI